MIDTTYGGGDGGHSKLLKASWWAAPSEQLTGLCQTTASAGASATHSPADAGRRAGIV